MTTATMGAKSPYRLREKTQASGLDLTLPTFWKPGRPQYLPMRQHPLHEGPHVQLRISIALVPAVRRFEAQTYATVLL